MHRIKVCVLALALLALGGSLCAWELVFGGESYDEARGVATDGEGNIYVCGYFSGSAKFGNTTLVSKGNTDIFAAKLDADGNWLWAVQAGGSGDDQAHAITVDAAGNAHFTGEFSENAGFGDETLVSQGDVDLFVAKLDADGNWLWVASAGARHGQVGLALALDAGGNCYVTGWMVSLVTFGSFQVGDLAGMRVFAAKLDPDGTWLWARKAGVATQNESHDIVVDSQGNAYITGTHLDEDTFGIEARGMWGDNQVFTASLDKDGNWRWAQNYGGNMWDEGSAIALGPREELYFAGHYRGYASFGTETLFCEGDANIFVAALDHDGLTLWAQSAGGEEYDTVSSLQVDAEGKLYLAGDFQTYAAFGNHLLSGDAVSSAYVAKLDADGNWLWAKNVLKDSRASLKAMALDSSGYLVLAGRIDTQEQASGSDAFLIRESLAGR